MTSTRAVPEGPVAALPPAGPTWFGSVMGTAILATLLQTLAGRPGALAAAGLLAVAWALLLALAVAFVRRCARDRGALPASVATPVAATQWGMVSMGLLAVGSATTTVIGARVPDGWWWAVGVVLWVVGTALGFATAVGFAVRLVRRDPGEPTTVWGLAVVPPMVTATTGASLVPHAGVAGSVVLGVSAAGFAVALCLGSIVFGMAYHHHWRVGPVPVVASASAWIPLGIVGQSVAAAQLLADGSGPGPAALAHAYGAVVLLLGLPLAAWATAVTVRGFRARMPFTPGWWAMTFPVGTIALGAHLLAAGTGWQPPRVLADVALVTLVGTWTLCAVAGALSWWQAAQVSGARSQRMPVTDR